MEQTLSRYEINIKHALQQLRIAINESDTPIEKNVYIIAARNSTNDYTYDFTVTYDGAWCDTCFEMACDTAYECALSHKGERYVVVLGKHIKNHYAVIKEYNIIK